MIHHGVRDGDDQRISQKWNQSQKEMKPTWKRAAMSHTMSPHASDDVVDVMYTRNLEKGLCRVRKTSKVQKRQHVFWNRRVFRKRAFPQTMERADHKRIANDRPVWLVDVTHQID